MFPLWPSINPGLINGSLMNNATNAGATNEEQEITALEHEQQNYLQLVENIAQDLIPLGKMQSETQNDADSDDADDASDDQESSASEAEDAESDDDNEIELT